MVSTGHNKEVVAIFAKCFRLITKLNVAIDDEFFADLLNQGSERLLDCYINFLKCEGTTIHASVVQPRILQHQDVVKSNDTVQRRDNVAQYCSNFISQIKNILNFLNILKHLKLSEPIPCLLLEKNLLYLESLVLDFKKQPTPKNLSDRVVDKPLADKKSIQKTSNKLGVVHSEISSFIGGRERIQNTEVFIKFAYITRRTLKRKLSELINAGIIKRLTLGKKVFYQKVDQDVDKIVDET